MPESVLGRPTFSTAVAVDTCGLGELGLGWHIDWQIVSALWQERTHLSGLCVAEVEDLVATLGTETRSSVWTANIFTVTELRYAV